MKITSKNNELMDPCNGTHSLINIQPEDKLRYISLITPEAITFSTHRETLKKIERIREENAYDDYIEDEHKQKLRKRNPENWKQNVRKRNKNKGLEYIKANGKVCESKKLGPPCTCKEKCYLKIGLDACKKIFQNFWKLGDHALQNAYIAGCVRIFLPKHCNKKNGIPSRRFFSRNFHVTVNGVDTEVCKQAFLNIHAISNGRLDRLLKKKQEIGNTGFDERGRHSNKVNKIPLEKICLVRKHIDSIRQKAGYTGKRKPKKVEILPAVLNIRTMYRSYKEEMSSKGLEPVCEYRYRKIFHTDYHLDFGKIPALNDCLTSQKYQQHQKHLKMQNHGLEKQQTGSTCLGNCSENKMELPNVTVQDMNFNVQVNTNLKGTKSTPVYAHLGTPKSKEYQMRSPDPTSYVLSQEVFQIDYSNNYHSPQQNWIFSNQS